MVARQSNERITPAGYATSDGTAGSHPNLRIHFGRRRGKKVQPNRADGHVLITRRDQMPSSTRPTRRALASNAATSIFASCWFMGRGRRCPTWPSGIRRSVAGRKDCSAAPIGMLWWWRSPISWRGSPAPCCDAENHLPPRECSRRRAREVHFRAGLPRQLRFRLRAHQQPRTAVNLRVRL